LQAVIRRHDILRTAVLWEGLPEPVQVVWRHAPLHVEEVGRDGIAVDVAEQLAAPQRRMDPRQAPLLRALVAQDAANARWLMLLQFHHLALDHVTLERIQHEVHAHLLGQAEQLAVVLQGTVELTLEKDIHDLKRGDAAGIPAGNRHCWRNKSKRPSQILIVTARRPS
jgi:quercetin dioxygenase-like cupin family protein